MSYPRLEANTLLLQAYPKAVNNPIDRASTVYQNSLVRENDERPASFCESGAKYHR